MQASNMCTSEAVHLRGERAIDQSSNKLDNQPFQVFRNVEMIHPYVGRAPVDMMVLDRAKVAI